MDAPRPLTDRDFPEANRLPVDLNPLAEGVFMAHQRVWLEDGSDLKICQKGRRTGITFAEAWQATLTAAARASAGGGNYFYIGDTKEKGLEFVGYIRHFATCIDQNLKHLEEFLFEDKRPDGSSRFLTAYRARFASGFRVEALSSRPENIRGLQGTVCIDEAAFHTDVREVIAAVNAMLIWGGKVRVISTHNGQTNPFNQLITEALTGKSPWRVHTYSFRDAIRAGLFARVCARQDWQPTRGRLIEWYRRILRSYGANTEARDQELFVIPAKGDGVVLPLALIEARQVEDYRLVAWRAPPGLVDWPEDRRHAEGLRLCEGVLAPLLAALPNRDHYLGEDFGRCADRTDIAVCNVDALLTRHYPLIVELADVPRDVQQIILHWIIDRLPRFRHAVLDATGNGFALAEAARQKYGPTRITELKATAAWYREHMPDFLGSFAGSGIRLPKHQDVRDDLGMLRRVGGVVNIPSGTRRTGTDGAPRHGDAAMAIVYGDAASRAAIAEYAYRSASLTDGAQEDRGRARDRWRDGTTTGRDRLLERALGAARRMWG